jgi:hypothetical protein
MSEFRNVTFLHVSFAFTNLLYHPPLPVKWILLLAEEYGVLVPLDGVMEAGGRIGAAVAAHLDDQALARKLLLGRLPMPSSLLVLLCPQVVAPLCSIPYLFYPCLVPSLPCSIPALFRTCLVPYLPCSLPALFHTGLVPCQPCSMPALFHTSLAPSVPCSIPAFSPPSLFCPFLCSILAKFHPGKVPLHHFYFPIRLSIGNVNFLAVCFQSCPSIQYSVLS